MIWKKLFMGKKENNWGFYSIKNLKEYIYDLADYVVKDMKIVKYNENLTLNTGQTILDVFEQNRDVTFEELEFLKATPNSSLFIINDEDVEQVGFTETERNSILKHLYKYLQDKNTPDGFKEHMYKLILEMAIKDGLK